MIQLRGMTWDHIRGYGPLLATTEAYGKLHPHIRIDWEKRSLKDFGDFPVEQLAQHYDIILIDHPHVGICSEQGVLVPLNDWLDADYLLDQQTNSVGASHESYRWNNRHWALAVDAAAQVAAYRPDLVNKADLPRSWLEVFELAESLPSGRKIGWPLCPTDTICSFITLCFQLGGDDVFDPVRGVNPEAGADALSHMERCLSVLHPLSLTVNPILMLNYMSNHDDIVYVPLTFGYSYYARSGFANRLIKFADIPSFEGVPRGSILGGVGMAVSARSRHIEEAVRYAAFTASGETQRTIYVNGGGQPGHRSAWTDAGVNAQCGHYFVDTLRTMDLSCVRPRDKTFPGFQEASGEFLHEHLLQYARGASDPAATAIAKLNGLYGRLREQTAQ